MYTIEDHFPNLSKDAKTSCSEASILPFLDDRTDYQFIDSLATHWIGPIEKTNEGPTRRH